MLETFTPRRFNSKSRELIETINGIIDEYQAKEISLTLRQLYYQLVARNIVENTAKEYGLVSRVVSKGRVAGVIDWDAIEDRTRILHGMHSPWSDPAEIIRHTAPDYYEDMWASQMTRPEVFVEKDAALSVIEKICNEYRVPFFACRGYSSTTAMYDAGRRLRSYYDAGQNPIVLHIGDHDPSGMNMTADLQKRLNEFAEVEIEVRRIALNKDQVAQYDLPPNPLKEKGKGKTRRDTRADKYEEEHGDQSWELDALEPEVLTGLISAALVPLIDDPASWQLAVNAEENNRDVLKSVSDNWAAVEHFVGEL